MYERATTPRKNGFLINVVKATLIGTDQRG